MCYIPLIYSLGQLLTLPASIQVSDEPWIPLLIFHEIAGGEDSFRKDTSNRDRKCVISGISIPEIHIQAHHWTIFEAAHIFPPEHEAHWIRDNYGRWITDMGQASESAKLNSIQNGLLLRADISGNCSMGTSSLWHYRQSVLANVRGAGEPIIEHDFPPGTDMVDEISAGPYARERFELEIAARLRGVSEG
ncbi:hypothetical protein HOY82DRAFT_563643 [Tuber indicum]|nr:hypothetical protein HOY82DRAFT_563643 [Tuber indicum]